MDYKRICDKINYALFYMGMDDYLASIGRFSAEEIREYIKEYEDKYKDGKIILSDSTIDKAYGYIKNELIKEYGENIIDTLCEEIDNNGIEYEEIIEFVNYNKCNKLVL